MPFALPPRATRLCHRFDGDKWHDTNNQGFDPRVYVEACSHFLDAEAIQCSSKPRDASTKLIQGSLVVHRDFSRRGHGDEHGVRFLRPARVVQPDCHVFGRQTADGFLLSGRSRRRKDGGLGSNQRGLGVVHADERPRPFGVHISRNHAQVPIHAHLKDPLFHIQFKANRLARIVGEGRDGLNCWLLANLSQVTSAGSKRQHIIAH
mmetsp:Transcript_11265/g.31380  ORF Transcript_11265/g.31380 Transcript_11265/m.31380 type:complete len:206 (+) Transcript_11265:686-1303(+)